MWFLVLERPMLRCPQCNKPLTELTKDNECPLCRADLDLLVYYDKELRSGLELAEQHLRKGELGEAVWAYLAVLEVDPDNATARRQVGQVATAVRQFDRTAPGRRWISRVRGESEEPPLARWLRAAVAALLVVAAFCVGYFAGSGSNGEDDTPTPPVRHEAPKGKLDKR
jgi:hypothetical protein